MQPQGKHNFFLEKEARASEKNVQTSPEPPKIKEEAETPKLKEKPKQRKKVKRTRIVNDAHRVPEENFQISAFSRSAGNVRNTALLTF